MSPKEIAGVIAADGISTNDTVAINGNEDGNVGMGGMHHDAFDIGAMTPGQTEAMFSEMLGMTSPSQWMGGTMYQ